jgi:hypothetical protein
MGEMKRAETKTYSIYQGGFASLITAAVVNEQLSNDLLAGTADLFKFTLTDKQREAILTATAGEGKSKTLGEFTRRVLKSLDISF